MGGKSAQTKNSNVWKYINALEANKLSLLNKLFFHCFYLLFHLVMNITVNLQSNEQFYTNKKNIGTLSKCSLAWYLLLSRNKKLISTSRIYHQTL